MYVNPLRRSIRRIQDRAQDRFYDDMKALCADKTLTDSPAERMRRHQIRRTLGVRQTTIVVESALHSRPPNQA